MFRLGELRAYAARENALENDSKVKVRVIDAQLEI